MEAPGKVSINMKKVFIILSLLFFFSFQNKPAKILKVEAELPAWQNVLNVIDQSDASAKERIAARTLIIEQLNKQITDTTKK
jgi:hypothetical protein